MAESASKTRNGFYLGDQVEISGVHYRVPGEKGQIVDILDAQVGYVKVGLQDGREIPIYDCYLTRIA